MTQHTPGPWETDIQEHDTPYEPITIRPVDRKFHKIATVYMDDAPVIDFNQEQRANAQLMKAAPSMLAALKGVMEQICFQEATGKRWDDVRAAIEEAEGRT